MIIETQPSRLLSPSMAQQCILYKIYIFLANRQRQNLDKKLLFLVLLLHPHLSFWANTKSHIRLQILSVVVWANAKIQIDYRNRNIQKQIAILQLQILLWHIIGPLCKHLPHWQRSLQLDIAWFCFHPNRYYSDLSCEQIGDNLSRALRKKTF